MRKEFESDSSARVAQNAVTSNNLSSVTLRRDLVQEIDFTFSTNWMSGRPQIRRVAALLVVCNLESLQTGDYEEDECEGVRV